MPYRQKETSTRTEYFKDAVKEYVLDRIRKV